MYRGSSESKQRFRKSSKEYAKQKSRTTMSKSQRKKRDLKYRNKIKKSAGEETKNSPGEEMKNIAGDELNDSAGDKMNDSAGDDTKSRFYNSKEESKMPIIHRNSKQSPSSYRIDTNKKEERWEQSKNKFEQDVKVLKKKSKNRNKTIVQTKQNSVKQDTSDRNIILSLLVQHKNLAKDQNAYDKQLAKLQKRSNAIHKNLYESQINNENVGIRNLRSKLDKDHSKAKDLEQNIDRDIHDDFKKINANIQKLDKANSLMKTKLKNTKRKIDKLEQLNTKKNEFNKVQYEDLVKDTNAANNSIKTQNKSWELLNKDLDKHLNLYEKSLKELNNKKNKNKHKTRRISRNINRMDKEAKTSHKRFKYQGIRKYLTIYIIKWNH